MSPLPSPPPLLATPLPVVPQISITTDDHSPYSIGDDSSSPSSDTSYTTGHTTTRQHHHDLEVPGSSPVVAQRGVYNNTGTPAPPPSHTRASSIGTFASDISITTTTDEKHGLIRSSATVAPLFKDGHTTTTTTMTAADEKATLASPSKEATSVVPQKTDELRIAAAKGGDTEDGKMSIGKKLKAWYKRKRHHDDDTDDSDTASSEDANVAARASAHIDPANDTTDPTPFFQKPLVLASLVDPKNMDELEAIGGVDGLLHGLGVDGTKGLSTEKANVPPAGSDGNMTAQYGASLQDRERVYGPNIVPTKKTKNLFQLMWMAMKDKVLVSRLSCLDTCQVLTHLVVQIILGIAAVISLALGIYQSVGAKHPNIFSEECPDKENGCPPPPSLDWIEGIAILIAVTIVVLVGSVNDWQKELQFKKLNEKKDDRVINCLRNGQRMTLNTKEILVGDVCIVETGEVLPVDGIFLRGHNVKCDESGATGESDLLKKAPYEECLAEYKNLAPGKSLKKDCFLISGSKVTEGVGEYVAIAVGTKSFNGRLMMGE